MRFSLLSDRDVKDIKQLLHYTITQRWGREFKNEWSNEQKSEQVRISESSAVKLQQAKQEFKNWEKKRMIKWVCEKKD